MDFSLKIAKKLNLVADFVRNTIELLNEGATIPFIARYRKEATGSMDEVAILQIKETFNQLTELENRKSTVLHSIDEQGKLTDELKRKIEAVETMYELEDLYLPYKPKRKTRASVAKEKGLEGLAEQLYKQANGDVVLWAKAYVNKEKGVNDEEEALQGACDILAESITEQEITRAKIRKLFVQQAMISSKIISGKEAEGNKYEIYFDNKELIRKVSSHRLLAMFRGEEEGFLRVKVEPEEEDALDLLYNIHLRADNVAAGCVADAIDDGYKRLLQPQMETEMRQEAKVRADEEAIRVFADNVRQLLLAPPLGEKVVMALDPGFRTGCKVVVLDTYGKLLENATIYPHPPQVAVFEANKTVRELAKKYKVEAIAIGNGTAGRETEHFIRYVDFEVKPLIVVVNENGASVYSASDAAREEFPDYDITVRGAVSIGRRLMDPLAELIKIDPKSIGVGQYQHDVNQKKLQESLAHTVESCVNAVGVEVNTASKQLLAYVSGIGSTLAENIVTYRSDNGGFKSKAELKKVKRFGEKAFEQAAGFLRIRDAKNPLDSSAVHPESYPIVKKMASSLNCSIADLIEKEDLRKQINIRDFVTEKIGIPTLTDIMKELAKPGRDPREEFDLFEFDQSVSDISDLKVGMVLPGVIVNIAAFGCFVDIGVHQDGLVHISQMAKKYVDNPNKVVKLNQKVMVKVMDVDLKRKRITLSMNID
ncbi:MAG: Tex family protein [Bacteroidales bacterium]|nr:Tex family protein [Bacteroidales bacterium]MDD4209842.1 Tex family protein [Bacteroidales bacterium]